MLLKRFFGIQEHERPRALLMFTYLFLVISCLLIVKPVRNSLFLKNFGAANLPYVFVLVAISAAILTHFYSRFAGRTALNRLINATLLIIISNLAIFWILLTFDYQAAWFIYGFYVWVAIFAVITTSQFWTLANEIFNAREAKKLFGFIGAGGISGGIAGGYATTYLAPLLGTRNLLLICILFLSACLLLATKAWALRDKEAGPATVSRKDMQKSGKQPAGILDILKSSRHLRLLTLIVGVGVLVANLVDFQYSTIAEQNISDEDELTAFFGFWLSNLSVFSLAIQLFITRRVMSDLGVIPSLLFLPAGILIGAVSILFYPGLWSGILIKVSEGSFKQSIHKAGLELLILPVPANRKRQAKAFIDIFVDSVATGGSGLLLLLVTGWLGLSLGGISMMIIGLTVAWIVMTLAIRQEYIAAFRRAIEKREIDPQEINVNPSDGQMMDRLIATIYDGQERQILYSLDLLSGSQDNRLAPHLRTLLDHSSIAVRSAAMQMLIDYPDDYVTARAQQYLQEPMEQLRMSAVDYLVTTVAEKERESLFSQFLSDDNFQIRSAAVTCIATAIGSRGLILELINFTEIVESEIQAAITRDDISEERQLLAKTCIEAIGLANIESLFPLLPQLMRHQQAEIARAAIKSAGMTGEKRFAEDLIAALRNTAVRKEVRDSLAALGEEALSPLLAALDSVNTRFAVRQAIPRVVQRFANQAAADALLERLDYPLPQTRHLIIRALGGLHRDDPAIAFPVEKIRSAVFSEIANYHLLLSLLYHRQHSKSTSEAGQLLLQALGEKSQNSLERIFRLLGLIYHQRDIFLAWLGIASNNPALRANAVEFLDNVLDSEIKRVVIPLIEFNRTEETIMNLRQKSGIQLPEDDTACMRALLSDPDPWLQTCALFFIAKEAIDNCRDFVTPLLESPEFMVRQTAALTLKKTS